MDLIDKIRSDKESFVESVGGSGESLDRQLQHTAQPLWSVTLL